MYFPLLRRASRELYGDLDGAHLRNDSMCHVLCVKFIQVTEARSTTIKTTIKRNKKALESTLCMLNAWYIRFVLLATFLILLILHLPVIIPLIKKKNKLPFVSWRLSPEHCYNLILILAFWGEAVEAPARVFFFVLRQFSWDVLWNDQSFIAFERLSLSSLTVWCCHSSLLFFYCLRKSLVYMTCLCYINRASK
jgi:hypothetical protein